jgi:AcrR family transcriptional regulator
MIFLVHSLSPCLINLVDGRVIQPRKLCTVKIMASNLTLSILILTLSEFRGIMSSMKTQNLPTDHRTYHHGNLSLALLDAAEDELNDFGIEGFSLRGVAKRAGVSHAAPAHHFSDANGLLTALAARGFEHFIKRQRDFRLRAPTDARAQLAASGVGYVVFALEKPALFRLMFSSDRPDFDDPGLQSVAESAFEELVEHVRAVTQDGGSPKKDSTMMIDVAAAWAVAHGLADLLVAGRLQTLGSLAPRTRDRRIAEIITRSIPLGPNER